MPKFLEWKILGLRVWHILLFAFLTFLYEIVLSCLGFSVRDLILPWLAPSVILAGVFTIAAAAVGSIASLDRLTQVVNLIIKAVTDKLQVTTIWGALLLILVLLIGPAYAAYLHPAGRIINTLSGEVNHADAEESSPPQEQSPPVEQSVPPEPSMPLETAPPPEETAPWDGILEVPDEVLILGPNSQLHQEIFFQAGDTPLANWTAEGVEEYVRTEVEKLIQQQEDPNFAETDTPQTVKDDIFEASELDKTARTLANQKEVIDMRLLAYSQYPEYRLTTLIREDYCTCGDAYAIRGLSSDTAVYYFANSIHWGLEALKYAVPASYNLSVLAERYQKIADNTPADDARHDHAQLLADAFTAVSASYT